MVGAGGHVRMLTEGVTDAVGAAAPPPARCSRSRCSKLPIDPSPTGALPIAPPPPPPPAALAPLSVFIRLAACPPPFSMDIMIDESSLSPGLPPPAPRFSPPPPSSICLFNSASFFIASSVAASSKTEDSGLVARRRGVWPAMAAASIAARPGSMPVASNRACSSVCFRVSSRSRAMLRARQDTDSKKSSAKSHQHKQRRLTDR